MTPQEIEYLRQHPKCVEIEFPAGSGVKRPWLLCDIAFENAERAGVYAEMQGAKLIEAQAQARAVAAEVEAADDDVAALAAVSKLPARVLTRFTALRLWAGFSTFDTPGAPAPSLDFVRAVVSAGDREGYEEQMQAPYRDALATAEGTDPKAEAPEAQPESLTATP